MSGVYIYGLCDPRSGELRYIGKSTNVEERVARHIRKASARYLRRWIAGLLAVGLRPEVVVLDQVNDSWEASIAEQFWIASMRLCGCRLTNLTYGGDGQRNGYKHTPEARLKQSIAEKGKPWSASHRANHAAALASPQTRAKMSASRKGKPPPRAAVEGAIKALTGKRRPREIMEKAWAGSRAKKLRRLCSQLA